ncbi:diguanylate cyclase [Deinococcus sp. JMULE3]|uniref:GGDEF domain-containing protein n=1 Tax=Deinococcus sp. JMULE3 TaxID=2518341 RepID=UPI001576B2A1|nr:GGDEF domain-containing protein [Deinococcus sp. JMULE3]NTY00753.1 GGDEF domain-containing protein [Deinococcus sp. JMULE3]
MPHRTHIQDPPLHDQVGRLYFRAVLPAVTLALAFSGEWRGSPVLLVLTLIAALGALVHLLLPERPRDVFRYGFVGVVLAFLLLVALAGPQQTLRGTPATLSVALLFTPATLMAWTLLFADRPRTALTLNAVLTTVMTLLVWRWQTQGLQPGPLLNLPLLVAVISATAVYYALTFTQMNARYHAGERDRLRDPLTGLLNRRALNERPPDPDGDLAVAVLDIDHFKRVNDTHGHVAGDRVLRAVADVMQDTLAGHGEAYRWGGEEFVLLLPDPGDAPALVEAVRREIAARHFTGGQRVTLSAGLTRLSAGEDLTLAFERADAALRAAKDAGRDRVVLAPPAPPLDRRAAGR